MSLRGNPDEVREPVMGRSKAGGTNGAHLRNTKKANVTTMVAHLPLQKTAVGDEFR